MLHIYHGACQKEKMSQNIIHTAQKLADIFHIDLDTLSEELERNFEDIFDI